LPIQWHGCQSAWACTHAIGSERARPDRAWGDIEGAPSGDAIVRLPSSRSRDTLVARNGPWEIAMRFRLASLVAAAVGLLACGRAAVAQNLKLDAPTPPPGHHRPAPPLIEAYVDASDPAHPVVLKFSVVDVTTYAAEVPAPAGGSIWVTGFLKDALMDTTVTEPDGHSKSLNVRVDGKTIDLPLLGRDRHFTRVDTSVVRFPQQPGGPPQPVREVDDRGWHYPLPDGWVADVQPGGVSVSSPDHTRGFGFFSLSGLDTADPGQLVRRVVEQNGATSAKVLSKSFTPLNDTSEASFDIAFAGADHVARHLFVDAKVDLPATAKTGWVTVVVTLPDDWKASSDALHDMTDRVRPTAGVAAPAAGADAFAGVFSDGQLTVTVRRDAARPGSAYSGSIRRGDRTYELAATAGVEGLTGTFTDAAGHAFPLTATVDGGTMTLRTGSTTYALRAQAPATTRPAAVAPAG
jgi:hypothetical protein